MQVIKIDTLDGPVFDVALTYEDSLRLISYMKESKASMILLDQLGYEYSTDKFELIETVQLKRDRKNSKRGAG